MRSSNHGFTLVEVLISAAIFAIFMVGALNLLDTSTRISQLETELADTQENVRFAAYHIMRTARMMGGGGMPVAGQNTSGNAWITAELRSNVSGSQQIPGYLNAVDVLPGSDMLTLRGFFEVSPFFTDPNVAAAGSPAVISEYNPLDERVNNLDAFSVDGLGGRGVVFMGQGRYCVGEIVPGSAIDGSGTDRTLSLEHASGDGVWAGLNTTASSYPPTFQVFRVGILDSYTYYVDPERNLMRMRIATGADPEPVAINIGGLQVALGVDANGNGLVDAGEWQSNPPASPDTNWINSEIIAMRITVLGRTLVTVPDWVEPATTFTIEDGTVENKERRAKWRSMQMVVNLRNFSL